MQKTNSKQTVSKAAHRKVMSSTTLSRKYVRRPHINTDMVVNVKRSPKIQHFDSNVASSAWQNRTVAQAPVAPVKQEQTFERHPLQIKVNSIAAARKQEQTMSPKKKTAKELKDQAIKQALASAIASEPQPTEKHSTKKRPAKTKSAFKMRFGLSRVVIALACTAVLVFAVVYFVNLNMPDISLKVAAMQTGINASYPSYTPREYSLSSITSENKKILLEFKNNSDGSSYSITEEVSSWDSNALLNNYVKEAFDNNYSIIKEQGLTIYANSMQAAWVNGGVVYKLNVENGSLTNKQMRAIATSL